MSFPHLLRTREQPPDDLPDERRLDDAIRAMDLVRAVLWESARDCAESDAEIDSLMKRLEERV